MVDRSVRSLATLAVAASATFVAFAALSGCSPHRTFEDEVLSTRTSIVDAVQFRTFDTDEPVELKTQGAVAIDIDNFAGDVVVRADRDVKRTFVEVRRV